MKNLMFVCSGNTCRSPLAEGIAKKIFPDKFLKDIHISSAGTSAVEGLPASAMAIKVARMNAFDLTTHSTRLLNKILIRKADLIVTMTAQHKQTTGLIKPAALEYTYLLKEFCKDETEDIEDPAGLGLEAYKETFDIIKACIEGLKDKLADFDGWKH